jgi:glycosyltransferase involved in cell wall biosynthesis
MIEEKGVWILIDACRIINERGYSFRCNFIGEWSDVDESGFNERVSRYALREKVFAYGAKYGNEKRIYFKNSDVFVFPTYYNCECFPLVLLEAMEYGLPCISTFEGGIPSIIKDRENGLLVKQCDASGLANNMIYMIEHPDLCQLMGKAGRKRFLELFTLDIFEKNFIKILRKCV